MISSAQFPKLVLYYWGFKGRAQPIRDCLRIGKIEFEDNTSQNFEQFKQSDNLPLNTWPVLDVDGERFCESNALLFYVGRLAGLVPNSPKDELRVLEILEVVEDVLVTLGPTFRLPRGPEQVAARQQFLDGAWRRFATLFEKRLQTNQNNSAFFVGRSLTVADLKFFAIYEMFASGQLDPISRNAFNDFPLLAASTAATAKIVERARTTTAVTTTAEST